MADKAVDFFATPGILIIVHTGYSFAERPDIRKKQTNDGPVVTKIQAPGNSKGIDNDVDDGKQREVSQTIGF